MATESLQSESTNPPGAVEIRGIGIAAPFGWLREGWRTFRSAPIYSLLYGAFFAVSSLAAVDFTRQMPWLTITFLTGMMLVTHYLAAGLYPAAQQRLRGESISIREAIRVLRSRATNLAFFALFLGLIMAAWVRLASLLFAVMFTTLSPPIEGFVGIFSDQTNLVVVGFFVLIGFILAATVFTCTAIAVPLIIDRDDNPFTAVLVSVKAVAHNWAAMLLWAALIATLTIVGIITGFAAMVVIFPVLGYATWHAYRELVIRPDGSGDTSFPQAGRSSPP